MNGYGAMLAILIIAGAGLVGGCVAKYASYANKGVELPAQVPFELRRDVRYTSPDWPATLEADVYVPESKGLRPAVLVVHGGSWSGGGPWHMHAISRGLARHGFVVMNVAYRLAPEHLFPAAPQDLREALRWLEANASELRVDPQRIGGFGYSAGAHLVSLVGAQPAPDHPALKAVVAGGTPADLGLWPHSPIVTKFLGKSFQEAPDLWREASPISHVGPNSPPMFLYHGGGDTLVEPAQSTRLRDALESAGVPVALQITEGYGHVAEFLLDAEAVASGIAFLAERLR